MLDAFRLAGATAPERARPIDDVVAGLDAEVRDLARAGVLRANRRGDEWYLDERAYIEWRDSRPSRQVRVALAIVLVVVATVLIIALTVVGRSPSTP